ncbi:MAG: hypothetical protein K940chlam8_00001, partial [Chlamydiae bacterium]|nr:hypothetical protein [Chlamydiota bacterium]
MRIQGVCLSYLIPNLSVHSKTLLVESTKKFPYAFFKRHLAGDISAKIHDITKGTENIVQT